MLADIVFLRMLTFFLELFYNHRNKANNNSSLTQRNEEKVSALGKT